MIQGVKLKPWSSGRRYPAGRLETTAEFYDKMATLKNETIHPTPENLDDFVDTNIVNCARCGGSHDEIRQRRFARKVGRHTHWATCPTTGEPILSIVIPDGSKGDAVSMATHLVRTIEDAVICEQPPMSLESLKQSVIDVVDAWSPDTQ